jgi:uncharacterized protein (DUF302 family)
VSVYTLSIETPRPFAETVSRVRTALEDQGFGVLTEVDVRATLAAKLGVEVPDELILGACRPELAHRAMAAAPSIAALLPCNVVIRDVDGSTTAVEAVDPDALSLLEPSAAVRSVADEARSRLEAALAQVLEED